MEPEEDDSLAGDALTIVVCDACVLINFFNGDCSDLLCKRGDCQIVITEHVKGEITEQWQSEILETLLAQDGIHQIEVTDPAELEIFAELVAVLGRGEAAAIAVAQNRGWMIATDETGRTKREIISRVGPGRLLTTPDLILRSIRAGVISVIRADEIKLRMEQRRFKMAFGSFQELVEAEEGGQQ
jgi:predicted nucleic acid-binding protein